MTSLDRVSKTVGTRGRLYTTERERSDLDVDGGEYGWGASVLVEVMAVDRSPDWGVRATSVVFEGSLGQYGEVRLPAEARRELGVDAGDVVRVSLAS